MNEQTQNGQILGDQDPNVTDDMYDDLGGGIASSFPVISYRSSRWRIRYGGNEELLVDQQGRPVDELGVCLVRVPNHKSKRYWINGYQQGNKAPDCWSNDAIRPHPTLPPPAQPQGWRNPTPTMCADCYWDQFNTALRQDGSVGKGKACADYKRCVVKIYYPDMPVGFEQLDGQLFLMQVPPDSLQTIKKYGEELTRERLAAAATITFVGLVVNDKNVSYPKLSFRKGPKLSSDEIENVRYLRGSIEATRILNEIPSGDEVAAVAYEPNGDGQEQEQQEQAPPPPPIQRVPPPAPRPAAPPVSRPAQATTGMPPAPPRAPAARPIAQQPVGRPAAPPVRRMTPDEGVGIIRQESRQGGGINTAVNRPAAPPPSTRPVRPALVSPPAQPTNVEEPEYGTAGDVEDALDKSFGDLAARGIIEQ